MFVLSGENRRLALSAIVAEIGLKKRGEIKKTAEAEETLLTY